MKFNPDITKQAIEVILSKKHTKGDHPPIEFNGVPVAKEDSTKHLGLIADSKLDFREHISAQIVKAKKGLALMKYIAKWVSAFV